MSDSMWDPMQDSIQNSIQDSMQASVQAPMEALSLQDIEKFRRIDYFVEGGSPSSLVYYILGGGLFLYGLIQGIISLVKHDNKGYAALVLGLVLGLAVAGYGFFRKKQVSDNLYTNVRKRVMENGVMYIGVVTDTKRHITRTMDSDGSGSTTHTFSYIVQYTDAYHNQKTTETYDVANMTPKDVGKRCTVYEHEGKVIVDAIER